MGFISPVEFIPIAEESGLIVPIGEWVLRTACTNFNELHKKGYSSPYVSVNVSSRQFEEKDFVKQVVKVLEETGFNPRFLKLEMTESLMMKNIEDIIVKLHKLEALGIEVLLDDFGTGYSSLSFLWNLPINTLKVDKSFIQSIKKIEEQETIVRTIIGMANSLNKGIIAEGVEREEQLLYLKANGCFDIQGYIFSKPVSYQEVPNLIQKSKFKTCFDRV